MNQENKTPHNFCETPEEKCTLNYCDENGCQNRNRHLVVKNKQLPTASDYIETVYGTKYFARAIAVQDAPSLMGLMEDFADHCSKPLREELEKLRAENERLENIISGYTSSLKDYDVERKHLINENQKIRELLLGFVEKIERGEKIGVNLLTTGGVEYEVAKEALKES